MYEMFVNVIQTGAFALEDMLEKIDTLWIQGRLSDGQRQALIHQARACALPEHTYAPIHTQLAALAERIAALEGERESQQWPEFKQPTGAHDAYHKDDQVTFQGKRYICVAPEGTAVVAAADGQVYTVYEDDQMGMTVVIRHEGGYTTRYSSLDAGVAVSAGQNVTMGQTIGAVGTSALMENALGHHVHFAVSRNDESVDPMDFLG